jgi:hypothetical protein
MQRKPNYDFERRERQRIKAAKVAQKAEAKRGQRDAAAQEPSPAPAPPSSRE